MSPLSGHCELACARGYATLLMKLGAAKAQAGRVWSLVELKLPEAPRSKKARQQRVDGFEASPGKRAAEFRPSLTRCPVPAVLPLGFNARRIVYQIKTATGRLSHFLDIRCRMRGWVISSGIQDISVGHSAVLRQRNSGRLVDDEFDFCAGVVFKFDGAIVPINSLRHPDPMKGFSNTVEFS